MLYSNRLRAAAAALAAILAAAPAAAGTACYTKEAFQAEQGLRLHTELMMIGLTCQRFYPEQNLFGKYQQFTTRNRSDLQDWEKTLMSFYRQAYGGNATARFDTFRTDIANEIAKRAALTTPPAYCAQQLAMEQRVQGLSPQQLESYVADPDIHRIGALPPCAPVRADLPQPIQVVEVLPYQAMTLAAPDPVETAAATPVTKPAKKKLKKKIVVKTDN